jgi:hypothetical protein
MMPMLVRPRPRRRNRVNDGCGASETKAADYLVKFRFGKFSIAIAHLGPFVNVVDTSTVAARPPKGM